MITVLSDRYELGVVLGSGGMARVYEGFDRVLSRRVAIKILRDDLSVPDLRQRFVREARTAAAFTHPNAVAVFDAGEDGRTAFIVMELVEGGSLADALARGPLAADRAADIAADVLAALGAAHQQGLVHRDIKPANILLPRDGGAKLADFGIAKSVMDAAANITATGQILGTPRYMSPEQVLGRPAVPQSDLYAMGVMLYEMLAGRPPFVGPNPIAVLRAHHDQPPPSLADARPDLHPALVAVVDRALQKDPARRYADAGDMGEALRQACGSPPPAPLRAAMTAAIRQPRGAVWLAEPTEAISQPHSVAQTTIPTSPQRRSALPLVVAAALLLGLAVFALTWTARQADEAQASPTADPPPSEAAQAPRADLADAAGPDPRQAPQQPESEAAPEQPAVVDPEPTDPELQGPQDLPSLVNELRADPQAAGKKGPELVERLEKVLSKEGVSQRKEARETRDKIGGWVKKGELDADVGGLAVELLEPYAQGGGRQGKEDD
jgi:eukaryotic-like serine/threonine-protein kinase